MVDAAAVQEQRHASIAAMDSAVGESSPPNRVHNRDKIEESEPLCLGIQPVPSECRNCPTVNAPPLMPPEFLIEDGVEGAPNVEHQFFLSLPEGSSSPLPQNCEQENPELKELLASGDEGISVSLQLGDPEAKRRKGCGH